MSSPIAQKSDWNTLPMPRRHTWFMLPRSFTPEQTETLRRGHIPGEMEDKWFWYMEGDCLYAHRSWTGICIYIIQFRPNGRHLVTVNRDSKQYSCKSRKEDRELLNHLLDWWSMPAYDAYGEWLSETAAALQEAKNKP